MLASGGGLQGWQIAAIVIDVVIAAALLLGAVAILKKSRTIAQSEPVIPTETDDTQN